jgi:predicted DNA-binding transcriptional regulator AlpA
MRRHNSSSSPHSTSDFCTIEDVAVALRVSTQTVARMVRRGEFPPPLRLSSHVIRWPAAAVNEYLESLQAVGPE